MESRKQTLIEKFRREFDEEPRFFASAPGRTEIGGNHTDHEQGMVLAGAVNLDTLACVRPVEDGIIRIVSEGYPEVCVDLSDLEKKPEEEGTTASLVRGIAALFAERGSKPMAFHAYVISNVLSGSGLSSSAAFEILIGTILNHISAEDRLSPVDLAILGQVCENRYFGKPCGLMDQLASSVGGVVFVDFEDTEMPKVEKIDWTPEHFGLSLVITDTGADHADLTDAYASIPREMQRVARFFGAEVLRDVPETRFREALMAVRTEVGDRAVLRAMHFYQEQRRVQQMREAMKVGNQSAFLELVKASGHSSWQLLQNITPDGWIEQQPMAFALACSEQVLDGQGATRVHGGGFAGTMQAYVPKEFLPKYRTEMERILGEGACQVLTIRDRGGRTEDI